MEKDITSFNGSLDELFGLPSRDWKQYSPLALAYIGDAAYDLVIRTIVVRQGDMQTQKLHRKVAGCVSAKAQSQMITALLPELTTEETSIFRRGRNAKPATKAKSATKEEYLKATGFEALIGYLYLNGSYQRMSELIRAGLKVLGDQEDERGTQPH